MKHKVFTKNEEVLNNKHIEDWTLSQGRVQLNLTGKFYEKKIDVRNPASTELFLSNLRSHKEQILAAKKQLGIRHVTLNFDFGVEENISLTTQKKLIEAQASIADDITIWLVGNRLADLEMLIKYATENYPDKVIAIFVDIKTGTTALQSALEIIRQRKEDISYLKVKYGKFSTWLKRYTILRRFIEETKLDALLTGCNKRCGVDSFRNIAVAVIAVPHFKFKAVCMAVKEHNGNRFPQKGVDIFNEKTWEYDSLLQVEFPVPKGMQTFRVARLHNLEAVNRQVGDIQPSTINLRTKVADLFQKLVAEDL